MISGDPVRPTGRETRSEDMFLAWFLRLPHDADIVDEARREIARIDANERGSGAMAQLRALLVLASAGPPAMPRGRSRSRH